MIQSRRQHPLFNHVSPSSMLTDISIQPSERIVPLLRGIFAGGKASTTANVIKGACVTSKALHVERLSSGHACRTSIHADTVFRSHITLSAPFIPPPKSERVTYRSCYSRRDLLIYIGRLGFGLKKAIYSRRTPYLRLGVHVMHV